VYILFNLKTKEKILLNREEITIGHEHYLLTEETEEDSEDSLVRQYLFIDGDSENKNKENEIFIQRLLSLNNFSQKVSSILDFGTLLNVIMAQAARIINTDKGFLIYSDDEVNYALKAVINLEKEIEDIDKFNNLVKNKILSQLKDKNSIIINNFSAPELKDFKRVIAAKLKTRNSLNGYLCLVNKTDRGKEFDHRDQYIFETLAAQAAIAIENSVLYEKVKNETDLRSYLQRYLPRNIVTKVLDNSINLSMVGETQSCSVLFADICGFTSLSEALQPKETVRLLNEYLTVMTKAIFSFNGSVDKFIGDGIMAVFGAPVETPNHALEATLAAIEMKKQLNLLKPKFLKEYGIKDFNQRIGINTGQAIYGNVGSPQRMDFTVIGDSVNLAARMEMYAPPGSILISKNTYEIVKTEVQAKEWEPITVKGKSEPVKVFEVTGKIKPIAQENADNSIRMHIRIPVKTFVSIAKNGGPAGKLRGSGLIRDISIGGVSVGAVGNYKANDEIEMSFKLNENISFRNIKGIVKYIEKSMFESSEAKQNLIMGVEFKNLTPEKSEEIIDFINASLEK
jgi:class 3 adenylate cyclase